MGVFKGVLSLALRICPEKYLAQEMKILIKFIITKEYMKNISFIKEKNM